MGQRLVSIDDKGSSVIGPGCAKRCVEWQQGCQSRRTSGRIKYPHGILVAVCSDDNADRSAVRTEHRVGVSSRGLGNGLAPELGTTLNVEQTQPATDRRRYPRARIVVGLTHPVTAEIGVKELFRRTPFEGTRQVSWR